MTGSGGRDDAKPLRGRKVLVTRAPTQGAELVRRLEELGAIVDHFAAIEIAPPPSWESLDAVIDSPQSFDWIIFTSANGVESFVSRARKRGADLTAIRAVKLAAVGQATADALRANGMEPAAVPDKFVSTELLPLLPENQEGLRTAVVRALEGRHELIEELRARGGEIHLAIAYETKRATALPGELKRALLGGEIPVVTFMSPSAVDGLMRHLGPDERASIASRCLFASIGPVTSKAIARHRVESIIEAKRATVASLCEAIVAALR